LFIVPDTKMPLVATAMSTPKSTGLSWIVVLSVAARPKVKPSAPPTWTNSMPVRQPLA
jgi:hypothetical protein